MLTVPPAPHAMSRIWYHIRCIAVQLTVALRHAALCLCTGSCMRPLRINLLYAPPLRHVTSCCINRFQAASRIDMPFWVAYLLGADKYSRPLASRLIRFPVGMEK